MVEHLVLSTTGSGFLDFVLGNTTNRPLSDGGGPGGGSSSNAEGTVWTTHSDEWIRYCDGQKAEFIQSHPGRSSPTMCQMRIGISSKVFNENERMSQIAKAIYAEHSEWFDVKPGPNHKTYTLELRIKVAGLHKNFPGIDN